MSKQAKPPAPELEPMLTIEKASERLAVSAKTVRRWIQAGKLPAVKLGRQWRIEARHVRAVIRGGIE